MKSQYLSDERCIIGCAGIRYVQRIDTQCYGGSLGQYVAYRIEVAYKGAVVVFDYEKDKVLRNTMYQRLVENLGTQPQPVKKAKEAV